MNEITACTSIHGYTVHTYSYIHKTTRTHTHTHTHTHTQIYTCATQVYLTILQRCLYPVFWVTQERQKAHRFFAHQQTNSCVNMSACKFSYTHRIWSHDSSLISLCERQIHCKRSCLKLSWLSLYTNILGVHYKFAVMHHQTGPVFMVIGYNTTTQMLTKMASQILYKDTPATPRLFQHD